MIKKIYKSIFSEKFRNNIIILLNRVKGIFLRGNKYYCNCCNKSFRKFLPKGNISRENAMCPNCCSLERSRLLLLYLQNETNLFKKHLKVLHFAPEICLYKRIKNLDIEYIDGDINPALARNVIDITNISFPDKYFDLIICSHVLGHVPDEKKAIKELYRVLAPNGIALIMTLIDNNREETFEDTNINTSSGRLKQYGEFDLVRLHGRDFAKRLKSSGFEVIEIDYRNNIDKKLSDKLNLGDGNREKIFKCVKVSG